ncbi:antibiotic biosynthesis monooxygenase family protein [Phytomonospora endophytica]|uniref:Heme-degrading monooxygenase HmoA n=1 Tax=Phytomonospora endophytica TaxID=714109 RepID=A0A841FQ21_9ACTN|nr:antibiotic biosynthesis monooxygenase [Phytomonospora endophytica]MBB6035652.1 heme-degrading monooxygenase HmoA [Phytomonospora endophytica]
MVLEVAMFDITPGREQEFSTAYAGARHLVEATEGCRTVRMTRGVESPSRFVLLIEWDSVEAHEQGFRASDRFGEWRAALGPFFASPPVVEHFADV